MASETWDVACGGWTESWQRSGPAGFDRIAVGSRVFTAGQDDLAALKPRHGEACAVCRGVLPQAFSYCFACGTALADVPVPDEPPQSAPQAGRPEAGLKPLALVDEDGRHERVALPNVGRKFAFAVAGAPSRLFAIDRDGGWAHEFDRVRTSWTRVFRVGENRLPDRSWSLAASPSGIVIPADGRLTTIDLASGPIAQPVVTTLSHEERCVGGACIVVKEARVPVLRAGVLHLARRSMVSGAPWEFERVQGAPVFDAPDGSTIQGELSAPMATETGVSWTGETGYVAAMLSDGGTLGPPFWRVWTPGFAPLLEHRPYCDPEGGVWQFGRVPGQGGRKNFAFERIGSPNQTGQERVGGSVLASGVLACRLLTLRHRAWLEDSPYNHDLAGRADDYLVPVQALGAECSVLLVATDRLAEFVNAGLADTSAPIPASLRLFDGRRLQDLALPVNLRSFSQIAAIVHDSHLYIYDALENECWRWKLRHTA